MALFSKGSRAGYPVVGIVPIILIGILISRVSMPGKLLPAYDGQNAINKVLRAIDARNGKIDFE